MIDFIRKVMAPVERRVMNMMARGKVTRVNDAGKTQRLQVELLADEAQDLLERFQQYGFSSVPKVGSECLVVFLGGNRDHGIVLTVNDGKTRKNGLNPGDVALYTSKGNFIVLEDESGDILLKAGGTGKIRLEADDIEIHAKENFKFDVDGHGYHYKPTHVDAYVIGATSDSNPLHPPEIP